MKDYQTAVLAAIEEIAAQNNMLVFEESTFSNVGRLNMLVFEESTFSNVGRLLIGPSVTMIMLTVRFEFNSGNSKHSLRIESDKTYVFSPQDASELAEAFDEIRRRTRLHWTQA